MSRLEKIEKVIEKQYVDLYGGVEELPRIFRALDSYLLHTQYGTRQISESIITLQRQKDGRHRVRLYIPKEEF